MKKMIVFSALALLVPAVLLISCAKEQETLELQGGREFRIGIVNSMSLDGLIVSADFDEADPHISENNFPIEPISGDSITMKLFFFTNKVTFDEAKEALESRGWHPVKINVLLMFAAQYPELQGEHPIIALGSASGEDNQKYSPGVKWKGGKKNLFLDRWKGLRHHYGYGTEYMFAVTR